MILEEKHFIECLAYVYSPALWISYRGSLYFAPKNQSQVRQIDGLKAARARYVALTNRETRYQIVHKIFSESGLEENWQKKLLLPYSDENPNLTPTLPRPFHVVDTYKIIQSLEDGDVIIQDAETNYLVMDFNKTGTELAHTNLYLVKEGERAFATAPGQYRRMDAFTRVGLSKAETSVLDQAVACFQKQASALAQELAGFQDRRAFEASKARATDSNPYQQYLVALAYLEGKGTPKDEPLGMEWMEKAARNGSGDAKSYLEAKRQKAN